MLQNYLYKCTDCETIQATREDLGECTWVLSCYSIRCQGMVKEFFRLDFLCVSNYYEVSKLVGTECGVVCEKEDMCDDTDTEETRTTHEY